MLAPRHRDVQGWLFKRPENLADQQRMSLRELLGYNLKSVPAYSHKREVIVTLYAPWCCSDTPIIVPD